VDLPTNCLLDSSMQTADSGHKGVINIQHVLHANHKGAQPSGGISSICSVRLEFVFFRERWMLMVELRGDLESTNLFGSSSPSTVPGRRRGRTRKAVSRASKEPSKVSLGA